MQSLFGTRTAADVNLAAQIILIIGLWCGFMLARKGRIPHHANVQTTMVLANLVFIAFAMATSFYSYVIEGGTGDSVARWMIIHGVLGTIAEASGIYLVLRMRTKWIPKRWRVRNFKLQMRCTLGLWTILVILGLIVYSERYLTVEFNLDISEKHGVAAAPILQLVQAGSDLSMHASEMAMAANMGNLGTAQRHAEHLVNLIEGSKGLHYGDLNTDGNLEDPGDGTGLLVYLDRVAAAAKDPKITEQVESARASLTVIRDHSLQVLFAGDLTAVSDLITETSSLARRTNVEGLGNINAAAQAAGVEPLPYEEPPMAGTPAASKVTIIEEDFAFKPAVITIDAGTTVVWINRERAKHTATSDVVLFDSGDQPMGVAYEYTFTVPGTYNYYCRFHGDKGVVGMAGTIIVE